MAKFPTSVYGEAGRYLDDYRSCVQEALASVDRDAFRAAADLFLRTVTGDGTIFCCGNGGSAAIANHLVCDCAKGIRTDTSLLPMVHSLSCNIELITAISNDISYDDVFAYQLQSFARPGDMLITISASGNSENIVRAARWASENEIPVIAMTGFSGGRSAAFADVNLHVAGENYGVVEDVHQSLMHVLAQYLRQAHMDAEQVAQRLF